jgi:death-on-curing protein
VSWIFLGVAAVEAIQADLIEKYGGSVGLRDAGLLESAVMRAENTANFNPDATTASIGASLSYGLIKNHAIIDGNKRVGLGALVDFLSLNGCRIVASQEEQVEMVVKVASNEISEDQWTAWVERSVVSKAGATD